ncbi:MAG: ABC-ATPase domain-containing protein [Pseudomonadota bacterium]|nr:MAG: ABC-ATPase domain-containing protein [Pseudomonadota bacterium]
MDRLRTLLESIDGKGYKAYKQLEGAWGFRRYRLLVDHVQGDPFAKPSRLRVQLAMDTCGLPEDLRRSTVRRIACEDYLGRAFSTAVAELARGQRGSGNSGIIEVSTSGQQVLHRNAVVVSPEQVEVRLRLGLPAAGRRVAAREAMAMLFEELPAIVEQTLVHANLPAAEVAAHVESIEDQQFLREWLSEAGLVAFVADGALLPRRSGVDDRPLARDVVAFTSPETLARSVDLPNAGAIRGMGVPAGVTLIVGGGFHGKSTLLRALERGVYDHLPGDGRERVVSDPSCMKVRAEDGRAVAQVDISPFIDNLPFGRTTERFSTENASGSTSQAANIIETLHTGCRTLLIDEDTSATNFMIRDARMQQLVVDDKEPITPFLHRARELYEHHGVSSVIVMGGSGDYFGIADTVIMMDNYRAHEVTAAAHGLAGEALGAHRDARARPFQLQSVRRPGAGTLDASRGGRATKIDVRGTRRLLYGRHEIDLSAVEQLVDPGQTLAIGWMLHYYASHLDGSEGMVDSLQEIVAIAQQDGLDGFSPWLEGELALPRLQELAAAVNRIRSYDWRGD